MDKLSNTSNKNNSRFVIIIVMAVILVSIAVWAAIQSIPGTGSNGSAGNTKISNVMTASPAPATTTSPETTGSNGSAGQVDMDRLAKDILSKTRFETELKQIDKTVAEGLVSISDGSEMQLYMGNGNYSDELILITAQDKESAEADQETVIQYLKDMRKSFEAYIPDQAKKISDAFNMRSGCYVVVCVTSDIETAKEIIMAAFE